MVVKTTIWRPLAWAGRLMAFRVRLPPGFPAHAHSIMRPTRSPRNAFLLLWALLVGCVCLVGATSAQARPFEISDESWEGYSSFFEIARGEAGRDRVLPVYEL